MEPPQRRGDKGSVVLLAQALENPQRFERRFVPEAIPAGCPKKRNERGVDSDGVLSAPHSRAGHKPSHAASSTSQARQLFTVTTQKDKNTPKKLHLKI